VYIAPPPTPTPHTPVRPRAVRGLGTAVIALAVTVLVAALVRLVASWLVYRVLFAEPDGDVTTLAHRLDTPLILLLASMFVLVPTLLAAGVTTLVWIHRARTNAASLSPHLRFRYPPGASVALLLIPFANLYFLGPVLADVCAGSSPYGRDHRGAALVRTFWATTVGSAAVAVLGNLAFMVVEAQVYGTGRIVAESLNAGLATAGMAFATVVYVLAVACTVLFALVVRYISRQQSALMPAPDPRW
jgi:hypothetical protein